MSVGLFIVCLGCEHCVGAPFQHAVCPRACVQMLFDHFNKTLFERIDNEPGFHDELEYFR